MNRRHFSKLAAATFLAGSTTVAAPPKLKYGILARNLDRGQVYFASPDHREEKGVCLYDLDWRLDEVVVYCPELKIMSPARMRIQEIPNRPISPISNRSNSFDWVLKFLRAPEVVESKDFKIVSLWEFERRIHRSVFD